MCAGVDSNHRRINPADLQSALVDRLSTDANRADVDTDKSGRLQA